MRNASSLSAYGWWLLSWLSCLALAALMARVIAVRTSARGEPVAGVFDAALTRQGRVSFWRTSALAALLTAIGAVALIGTLVSRGFVSWSQIDGGDLLTVLASGYVITLLPHYVLCRWLRRPLRQDGGTDWMMARIAKPLAAGIAALAGALLILLFFGVAMRLGEVLAQYANAFPTIPNLFTYPGQDAPSEGQKQVFLVSLFALYALALQLSWPLAALLWDGARALARAIGRPLGAQPREAGTGALMALATALHLILLPALW